MADDPDPRVAAYEAGVRDCHGAPPRPCCVRAGLAAVESLQDATPTPTPTPDQITALAITTAGAAIITAALAWRTWSDGGLHTRERDLAAAVDTYRGENAEGWGAMVRHGGSACTCGQRDITTYGQPDLRGDIRRGLFGDRGSDDPDCPIHGRRTRRCVCVETTTGAEYDQGRRTWLPGCERHPAPDAAQYFTDAIYDGHYPEETDTP